MKKVLFYSKFPLHKEGSGGSFYGHSIISHLQSKEFDVYVLVLETKPAEAILNLGFNIVKGENYNYIIPKYLMGGKWFIFLKRIFFGCNRRIANLIPILKQIVPSQNEGIFMEVTPYGLKLLTKVSKLYKWDSVICFLCWLSNGLNVFDQNTKKVILAGDIYHSFPLHPSPLSYEMEREYLSKGDIIIFISDIEKEICLKMLPEKKVVVARIALSTKFSDINPEKGCIMFVGADYTPNIEGVTWFLENVTTLLEKKFPGHFYINIVGNCCKKVNTSKSAIKTILKGRVDDMEQEYREAEVVIVPLFNGSGVSIKTVEALTHGKAVIANFIGARGLEDIKNGEIIRVNLPDEFADNITKISFNSELRKKIENNSKNAAVNRLTPDKSYAELIAALN
jgi:glycosyltransferase involved in cell wall biosynthesis